MAKMGSSQPGKAAVEGAVPPPASKASDSAAKQKAAPVEETMANVAKVSCTEANLLQLFQALLDIIETYGCMGDFTSHVKEVTTTVMQHTNATFGYTSSECSPPISAQHHDILVVAWPVRQCKSYIASAHLCCI